MYLMQSNVGKLTCLSSLNLQFCCKSRKWDSATRKCFWWSCYVSFKLLNDQSFFYTDRNAPIMTTSRNLITWRECSVNLWGSIHRPPGIPCVLTSNSDQFIIQRTEEKLKFFLVLFIIWILRDSSLLTNSNY